MKAAYVAFAFSLFMPISCRSPQSTQTNNQLLDINHSASTDVSHEFGDLFYQSLQGSLNRTQFNQIFYASPDSLNQIPHTKGNRVSIKQIEQLYKRTSPTQLYIQQAQRTKSSSTSNLSDTPLEHPITFVIIPGVFGEFIKNRPFEEIVGLRNSTYAQTFNSRIKKASSSDSQDSHFSLKPFKGIRTSLTNLITATSIDFQNKPAIQLIAFKMPFMSLESLGSNSNIASIYLRRLEKYFRVMGVPEHIVFLGYSRGTPLALEMLSQAQSSDASWLTKVKGMISLGGVVYGSDIADQIYNRGTKIHSQYTAIQTLRNSLKSLSGVSKWKHPQYIADNTYAWGVFLKNMVASDPSFLSSSTKNLWNSDPRSPATLLVNFWSELGLNNFFDEYSANIDRFKYVCDQLTTALSELTTSNRLSWWRTHQVPERSIIYYSLAATMADPLTETNGQEVASKYAYNLGSIDYNLMLQGYRDFVTASGITLNDSQVGVHKARFWPELIQSINPKQPPIKSKFLGILSTHHWAIALPVVNEMRNGSINPYPRKALIKALAKQVAYDLSSDQ